MKKSWSDDISEITLPTKRGWVTVGPYSVWIKRAEGKLYIQVYGLGLEAYDPLVECQCLDGDIPEDEDDE